MKRFLFAVLAVIFIGGSCFVTIIASAAEINTGGAHILKTDLLGTGLEGAGYQIAREATRSELEDSSVLKRLLKVGDNNLTVVFVPFSANVKETDGIVKEIYTDQGGSAFIYGLPFGTYYLVESQAPDGFERMVSPVRISINKYSHLTAQDNVKDDAGVIIDNTIHIVTLSSSVSNTEKNLMLSLKVTMAALLISIASLLLVNRIRKEYV